MFSITKDARDLKQATIAQLTHRNTGPSPSLFEKQEMTTAHGQAESLVLEILRPTVRAKPVAKSDNRATELEMAGATVLDLKPTEWRDLALAA